MSNRIVSIYNELLFEIKFLLVSIDILYVYLFYVPTYRLAHREKIFFSATKMKDEWKSLRIST